MQELMDTSWKCSPSMDVGILCGCDQAQEWLLPWWWEKYTRYNSFPVMFCDFGMSEIARNWCCERGIVTSIFFNERLIKHPRDVPAKLKRTWKWAPKDYWESRSALFKKPFGMLASPFKVSVWLDVDCEVLRPLDSLFDYCDQASLALAKTVGKLSCGLCQGSDVHNGGVVVFRHGIDIIEKQAELIKESNHLFYAEDNVLSYLIEKMNFSIGILPNEWNWQISDWGLFMFAYIAHWNFAAKKLLHFCDGMQSFCESMDQTTILPISAWQRAEALGFTLPPREQHIITGI